MKRIQDSCRALGAAIESLLFGEIRNVALLAEEFDGFQICVKFDRYLDHWHW